MFAVATRTTWRTMLHWAICTLSKALLLLLMALSSINYQYQICTLYLTRCYIPNKLKPIGPIALTCQWCWSLSWTTGIGEELILTKWYNLLKARHWRQVMADSCGSFAIETPMTMSYMEYLCRKIQYRWYDASLGWAKNFYDVQFLRWGGQWQWGGQFSS